MPEASRILIIDDSAEDRATYRRLLRRDPGGEYSFADAESAADGLRAVAEDPPACVLLDYRLPDSDGIEVIEELARRNLTDEIAIVVLTGQGNELIAVRAMKAGAQDYLVKGSVNASALIRSVRNAIERTRLLRSIRRHQKELERANEELRREVEQRRLAEDALQRNSENLERMVEARTSELSHANQLKDEFLATVSHELRTPLNAILGWSHVLREPNVPANIQQQALEAIARNVRWQANLIDDILDVSRIVSGKLRLDAKPLDLATVVDAALEAVGGAATAKDLRIEVDLERPAPAVGDATRLRQVVSNLLSNAVKFTARRGQVAVSLKHRADNWEIQVRDTGVGIDPAFLPHVFEPFRQGDASPTRRHGGLGLGLAIVRQLIERSGGSVRAASAGQGQGATFTIVLPRPTPDVVTSVTSSRGAAESPARRPNLDGVVLLAVDDDGETRKMLPALLARYGARVVAVSSAAEALTVIDLDPPQALLTDIAMPHSDGYALLRRIREHPDERVRSIPAIALTAYAGEEASRQALEASFQAHLAKPVDPQRLVRLLERLLNSAVHQAQS